MAVSTSADILQRRLDAAPAGALIELPAGRVEGRLVLRRPLTLRGAAEAETVIDARGEGPALAVAAGSGTTRLERLTLCGGRSLLGGGLSIPNGGEVIVVGCRLLDNAAPQGRGGGIGLERGTLRLEESCLEVNRALLGGGIYAGGTASVVVLRSRISRCRAGRGGALAAADAATLRLDEVQLIGNVANELGHALFAYGSTSRVPEIDLVRVAIEESPPGEAIYNASPYPAIIRRG